MTGEADLNAPWRENPGHRRWLTAQAGALFDFFEANSFNPEGGFFALDDAGEAIAGDAVRPLHVTTRMVHCPGNEMSAAKRPRPSSNGRSSSRGTERPTNLVVISRASFWPPRARP